MANGSSLSWQEFAADRSDSRFDQFPRDCFLDQGFNGLKTGAIHDESGHYGFGLRDSEPTTAHIAPDDL
jgi:hypothetical protein